MKISLFSASLVAASVAAASAPASAAVITFDDRALFTVATGANIIEDFTETDHFPISSGILNSSTTEAGLMAGEIEAGVTYSTPVGTGFFFNIDGGGGYVGGFLDSLGAGRVLTIDFDNAQSGFGFDANGLMGAFNVQIFSGQTEIYNGNFAEATSLQFFGFQSIGQGITSAKVAGTSATFGFALDNFTFGGVAGPGGVPEPSTWAMLVLGFGVIGAAARAGRNRSMSSYRT